MSKKNLVIAAAALCILAVITHFFGKNDYQGPTGPRVGEPILETKIADQLDQIQITSPDTAVKLLKKEGNWTIADSDGFPVNLEKLLRLTEHLTSYQVASLVTKDPQRLEHFEVTYQGQVGKFKGTQIVFSNKGQETFRMIVGKSRNSAGGTSGGTYIRIGQEPIVYLIKESLYLDADPHDWTRRHLFKADKKEIQSVAFKLPESAYRLIRKDEKKAEFTLADLKKTETFQKNQLSDVFIEFKDFNFRKHIEKTPAVFKGLKLKSTVTITTLEGSQLSFNVFEKKIKADESEFFVEILPSAKEQDQKRWQQTFALGERWIFEISNWKAERWFRTRDQYLKK